MTPVRLEQAAALSLVKHSTTALPAEMFKKPLWQIVWTQIRSTLFASILNLLVMLGNYLQQTTFSDVFFWGRFKG